jgi:cytidyltransferase-like protein
MLTFLGNDISKELYYAVCFHDVVYNPFEKDNERLSCEVLRKYASTITDKFDVERSCEIIMATKFPWKKETGDCKKIIDADTQILRDPNTLIEYENGIFYECQKSDIRDYIEGRSKFLNQLHNYSDFDPACISFLINYVSNRTYNIGIYAGSFNPYHRGHEDVIKQAENIFDKVIIAQGKNHDKENPEPVTSHRRVIRYDTPLWELFKPEANVKKTLIRGLRNNFDVGYEDNLRHTINDFANVPIMYFFCKKENEHLSSSMIRSLYPFGKEVYERYLPC